MQNADGYGTSGVCMSEMTFNIPSSDYGFQEIPPSAKVTFHMVGAGESLITFAPDFYIYSRSKKGGVISFKCYDRMIYTEQTITMDKNSFEAFGENEQIESQWVVQHIASQCGFDGWGMVQTQFPIPSVQLPIEDVIGKNCREILNSISEAWCGFFKVSNDNKLLFVPFGSSYSLGNTAFKHTTISTGGIKGPILQVIMSNGTETFTSGNGGADVFNTLKISSKYASSEIASRIMERIENYTYEAWECQKCILNDSSGSIEINAEIDFSDGSKRIANHITKIPTAAGIIVSCGSNDVTETEFDYTGALTRKINERIAKGELMYNVMITAYQGVQLVRTKDSSSAKSSPQKISARSVSDETENGIEKYSFNVGENGVTEFDGAIIDKTDFEYVEKVDDNTAIVAYPGGAKYKCTRTIDGGKHYYNTERIE